MWAQDVHGECCPNPTECEQAWGANGGGSLPSSWLSCKGSGLWWPETPLGLSILSSMGGNPGPSRILKVQIGIHWKGLLIAWDLLAIARTSLTIRE